MVKLFKHTVSLITGTQNSILSAASVIMLTVAFSRVLGLLRDRMLAARFTPDEIGIYYAAFRLPNMIFELLVMGALATAFIPVFTSYLDTKGKEDAYEMAASVINLGLIIFLIFTLPILAFTDQISRLFAPGFSPAQISLMASFTRIMLVAQVFPLIIGNFFTGILQSFRNFIIPSLAPVLYNVGIIIGILIFTPFFGLFAPVIGVVIGAVLYAAIQIPLTLSLGYRHHLRLFPLHQGTKEVGRLMLPRTLGLAVSQIDTTFDLVLSTLLGASAVTVFNFAQHLQQVPVGLFGASIAQAALPAFSSLHARKKADEFKNVFIAGFHQILFLVVPISSILIVLRIPLVRLVFGASTLFDWQATVTTGKTLAYFSLSLFAQSLIHLLARAFYSLHDSKTPVYIGAVTVAINTVFSVVFIMYLHFDVWSLGLSTSISSILNMMLLLYYLDRKVGSFNRVELILPALKIFLAGLVTGVALYIPIKLLDQLVFDTTKTINLFLLTSISTIMGTSVYLFLAWFLGVPQMSLLAKLYNRARTWRNVISIDTTQEVGTVQESQI